MNCKKTAVLANTKEACVDAKSVQKRDDERKSDATDDQSNQGKQLKTSKQANETAKREEAKQLPLNFARNREYLQKQIQKLEGKIESQSMRSSVAGPPDAHDERFSIAASDFSQDSEVVNRSSHLQNRSRNHVFNTKNGKGRKTVPKVNLIDGEQIDSSRGCKAVVNHHRARSDILTSNISLNTSVYMGGSAQADNEQIDSQVINPNVNAHLDYLEQQND